MCLFMVYGILSVRNRVEPRFIELPEELSQPKTSSAPSKIESAAFRLVAQCLNQLRYRVASLNRRDYVNVFQDITFA